MYGRKFIQLEYAHMMCDILDTSGGYQTNEDKMFITFYRKKEGNTFPGPSPNPNPFP